MKFGLAPAGSLDDVLRGMEAFAGRHGLPVGR